MKNIIRNNPKKKKDDPPRSDLIEFKELNPRYTILEKLGEGAFSKVYKAIDNDLNIEVAIKVIEKNSMSKTQLNSILKEISIMRRLDHPNIVKLYNYINAEDHAFIIIEFVSGGELFNQIVKYTYFSEDLSRHIIIQVVKAVDYLHSEVGVVHRDIKPENLLFEKIDFIPSDDFKKRISDDDNKLDEGKFMENVGGGMVGQIKLADFGLSKILWDSNTKTPCGTASYTAPEIVRDEAYSKSVDMWAIGCVLYTLLCGFPPFYDTDPKTLTMKVSKGDYTFLSPWWDEISKEAKDLVSHLLTIDPKKRYGTDEILNHPWILNNSKPTLPAFDSPLNKSQNEPVLKFEDTIPTVQQLAHLSPRAEAMKFAFDTGISIQRTGTPLRKILNEDHYFNESDDEDDDDEDSDDDDDDQEEEDYDDDDGLDPEVVKRFSELPITPHNFPKSKKSNKITTITESSDSDSVIEVSSKDQFREIDGFNLKFDNNTLLNRRKMSGSLACGPPVFANN